MDEVYQVHLKDDYEVLCVGTLAECEKWIHTDGKMDVTYQIEKFTSKQSSKRQKTTAKAGLF